jgi:hypothetical protein
MLALHFDAKKMVERKMALIFGFKDVGSPFVVV